MAILKYYKVDSDGKLKRLRRECPSAECGAGVFMGWHHDRQCAFPPFPLSSLSREPTADAPLLADCGKCGLTYMFEAGQAPPQEA